MDDMSTDLEETAAEAFIEPEDDLARAGALLESQQRLVDDLYEGMRDLQFALEQRGWKLLRGGVDQKEFDGLDLEAIKLISDELRSYLTGGSLAKRLIEVRANFVVGGGGVEYDQVGGAKRALDDLKNQTKLFGSGGLQEIVRAQGTDGTVILLVNTLTKEIRRLPLHRVDALYVDPRDHEDILFVKERYREETVENPQGKDVEVWYRVDLNDSAAAKRRATIKEGDRSVKIDKQWVAVIDSVNTQVGHTLGTPDLLASLPWLDRYNEYLNTQLEFQKALSLIAVHIKNKTTKSKAQSQSAIKGGGRAGIATTGEDTSIEAQRGGSDVSFENGRPLASMASTGAEVSVVHALSDPGAAGSSYGSAQTLDNPTIRMIEARRDVLSHILKRVLALLGAPKAEIRWPRIGDEQTYRLVQSLGLLWQTGLFNPEELREKFGDLVDLTISGTAPSGVLVPNNLETLKAQSEIQVDAAEATAGFQVNAQGVDGQGQGKMNDQSAGNRPDRTDE